MNSINETANLPATLLATIARLEKAVENHSAAAAAATHAEDRAWHSFCELEALRLLDLRRRFYLTVTL